MITCEIDEYIKACIFFMKELLPVEKIPDIDINFYTMHTLKGWCAKVETNLYEICMDNTLDWEIALVTLAHECVHVKQYVLGELDDTEFPTVWKGKPFTDVVEYDKLPWEKEAYGLELILFDKFKLYK